MKIINVVGARPNFMKIAPLMEAYRRHSRIEPLLVHTGQHYDEKMSKQFFVDLGIPEPDLNLEVGSGSHAVQTAEVMKAFEPVLLEHKPDAVVVVGDVNSTIACGLVAVKLGVALVHVEAGLRSGDRTMPEEINRILTDAISDLLFVTEQSGVDNLLREGVAREKIHLAGNVMVDSLLNHLARASESKILEQQALAPGEYITLTLHRPSNVDGAQAMGEILEALEEIQRDWPIVFPIHPRTLKNLENFGMGTRLEAMKNLRLLPPVGYLDFLHLMAHSRIVMTDSGGIQEETTVLKIPCLTLRENTERPVTVEIGSNQLVGASAQRILAGYARIKDGRGQDSQVPPLWDGKAAERIADTLAQRIG